MANLPQHEVLVHPCAQVDALGCQVPEDGRLQAEVGPESAHQQRQLAAHRHHGQVEEWRRDDATTTTPLFRDQIRGALVYYVQY